MRAVRKSTHAPRPSLRSRLSRRFSSRQSCDWDPGRAGFEFLGAVLSVGGILVLATVTFAVADGGAIAMVIVRILPGYDAAGWLLWPVAIIANPVLAVG